MRNKQFPIKFNFLMDRQLNNHLEQLSISINETKSYIVRQAIKEYLERTGLPDGKEE